MYTLSLIFEEIQNTGYAEYEEAKYVYAVLFRRNAKRQ
jgi:hypothetical protein